MSLSLSPLRLGPYTAMEPRTALFTPLRVSVRPFRTRVIVKPYSTRVKVGN
jgi:hypothetical protein